MSRDVNNSQNMLNSRDIITRLEDLRSEKEHLDALDEIEEWDEENGDEMLALLDLIAEADGSPDWLYGETLIRDTYFQDFARELAEDIGAISKDAPWPLSFIDWSAAAEALKQDYFSVDFDGVTYWIHS